MNKDEQILMIQEWQVKFKDKRQAVIPMKFDVVFPSTITKLNIGRTISLNALVRNDNPFYVLAYQKTDSNTPTKEDFEKYGTLCIWNQQKESKGDVVEIGVVGLTRVKIQDMVFDPVNSYWKAKVDLASLQTLPKSIENIENLRLAILKIIQGSINYVSTTVENARRFKEESSKIEKFSVFELTNYVVKWFNVQYQEKCLIFQQNNVVDLLQALLNELNLFEEKIRLTKKIDQKMRKELTKKQKEYFLREKIKAYGEELSEVTGEVDTTASIRKKIDEGSFPKRIKEKLEKELRKYEISAKGAATSNLILQYIDTLLNVPWTKKTEDSLDLNRARKVLDVHHYGLEKVKERIIEHLAVVMRNQLTQNENKQTGIICLVGPPGIGKTSLGRSIAETMNRKFVRVSLGGVTDESEIRGHRRTYVGAMPGRIIKAIQRAGVINPLFLLDEIDKMASDHRGDPAAAMLEVLDPEQNKTFSDNYIEEDYDLSKVLFICTANTYQKIPEPLLDRMEIIYLNSYTEQEKLQIAKRHLVKKALDSAAINTSSLVFSDTGLLEIIRRYTREAGVRELQRMLEKVARKHLVDSFSTLLEKKKMKKINITSKNVIDFLKKPIYDFQKKTTKKVPGLVNGLAYTEFGGDVLPIEVTYFQGSGKLILTGRLGDVFQESANIAVGYIKSNAKFFNVDPKFFEKHDVHVHVPEGAVPKDGPSAGITITTAILSSILKKSIDYNTGMTGEITLRGIVLPIGGLKEKVISAHRSGLKTVIIPKGNEKDVDEIPKEVRDVVEIKLMETYLDVYKETFKK